MSEEKTLRLIKVAKEFNVGIQHVVEYLESKGVKVDSSPNAKLSMEVYTLLQEKYQPDKLAKLEAHEVTREKLKRDTVTIESKSTTSDAREQEVEPDNDENLKKSLEEIKLSGSSTKKATPKAKKSEDTPAEPEVIKAKADVESPKILGKIDLEAGAKKKTAKKKEEDDAKAAEAAQAEAAEVKKKAAKKAADDEAAIAAEKVKQEAKKEKEKPVKVEVKEKAKEKEKPAEAPAAKPVVAEAKKEPEVTAKATTEKPVAEEKPAAPAAPETPAAPAGPEHIGIRVDKLSGPNILGKIELPVDPPKKKPVASSSDFEGDKKKRKRKEKNGPQGQGQGGQRPAGQPGQPGQRPQGQGQGGGQRFGPGGQRPGGPGGPGGQRRDNRPGQRGKGVPLVITPKAEPTDKEIQDQIKATLARLSGGGKSKSAKLRREKRDLHAQREEARAEQQSEKAIQVTEFVSANELAKMMDVQVNQVISTCMSLGLFVSINQRLDAETITVVAEEFGFKVEFVSADVQDSISDETDAPEDLLPRAPIVTVMGHVDHGKTSLLDYVRKANVIAGEAGGITQHIGAYEVKLEDGRKITFLDTPGHEAFTAMRARGAKVTDVAIIVIAADDSVMPQTKEAINHAQAAGVPIVFAINKVDKPDANPERIKEQLAAMNYLVEDWGGKYQSQEISAKKGMNIDKLLDKVLLEAELLDLKANPGRLAKGTVIESSLDKGRGYVTTILVQTGTLKMGDVVLAGCHSGRVKAMFNERGNRIKEAGPSTPTMILGMSGAVQAGDQFNVMEDEREAREIANKRLQLQREQGIRTHKHITLDEIGRRLAIGNFKELNIIVKGDVDGSVEALADSLLKLSTQEIQVNVILKGVGQISDSDIMLASASNAIIVGFQVRPSSNARKLAEQEEIDIRLYSIIYDAINEVKAAMEGMLAPEFEEKIVCNVEVRETFKIPKVGTVAGCMVTDGKINRNTKIRIIRDGIVMHSGELSSLKRFKDDAKDVQAGMECGLSVHNFNDIKVGDIIEGYENVAIKRTLA
ncbi:MAG: translation initiation factor IF-2 [Bacteroidia bacterium]|jgi:translation initiation factor IF-2|nr:translation initiation factor IF-2 [Bacteroidia bacterium]